MRLKFVAAILLLGLCTARFAFSGSIFDHTPFSGLANAVGNATGTNNLQQKLGLPNAGGAGADFFEAAKKDSGPLVTSVTTLACPGCVVAAGALSGPGAAMDAVFTTGLVTSAFETNPALGIATVVVLASDRSSGESAYKQVLVATTNVPASANTFDIKDDCILRDKTHNVFFAFFRTAPVNAAQIKDGDNVNLSAPQCKAYSDPTDETVQSIKVRETGAQSIGAAGGRFNFVITGT